MGGLREYGRYAPVLGRQDHRSGRLPDGLRDMPACLLQQRQHDLDVRVRREVAQPDWATRSCRGGQQRQGGILGTIDGHGAGEWGSGAYGDHLGGPCRGGGGGRHSQLLCRGRETAISLPGQVGRWAGGQVGRWAG
ncbi:hypothetical protein GCM10023084_68900 [Streptomyces lacrimifluminis]|uniref:Uncharacterized protein n=1 Tax=Streptomyces lacrimifluminis TaxID=1500077 RepID=A0A917P443_9ACTN|nr:hypothetical protein GCM10012282_67480 [Streptomyces lacrimifluminis]